MARPRAQRGSTQGICALAVDDGLVGIDDAIGASPAQQGGVVAGVPAKPATLEAATVR